MPNRAQAVAAGPGSKQGIGARLEVPGVDGDQRQCGREGGNALPGQHGGHGVAVSGVQRFDRVAMAFMPETIDRRAGIPSVSSTS